MSEIVCIYVCGQLSLWKDVQRCTFIRNFQAFTTLLAAAVMGAPRHKLDSRFADLQNKYHSIAPKLMKLVPKGAGIIEFSDFCKPPYVLPFAFPYTISPYRPSLALKGRAKYYMCMTISIL